MNSEKLKACPFCGSIEQAKEIAEHISGRSFGHIPCFDNAKLTWTIECGYVHFAYDAIVDGVKREIGVNVSDWDNLVRLYVYADKECVAKSEFDVQKRLWQDKYKRGDSNGRGQGKI